MSNPEDARAQSSTKRTPPPKLSLEEQRYRETTAALATVRKDFAANMDVFRQDISEQISEQAAKTAEIVKQAVSDAVAQAVKSAVQQTNENRQKEATSDAIANENRPPHPSTSVNMPCLSPQSNSDAASQNPPLSSNFGTANHTWRHKLYDLPDFDGNAEDWQIFVAEFEQTTAEYGYSNAQNVSRLRKSLCGRARDLVTCLLVRPENVSQAMATLERHFGKPQHLVASQVNRLRELEPVEDDQLDELVPFAAKVATMVAYLDAPKTRQHLLNPMILDELLLKLPQRERREWGRCVKQLSSFPTLKDFSLWLDEVADEVSEAAVKQPNPARKSTSRKPKNHQQYSLLAESSLVADKSRACGMCKNSNHLTTECYWLMRLHSDERWKAVKAKNLCGSCLEEHNWRQCTKKKACGIDGCRLRHHPLLHTASPPSAANPGHSLNRNNPFGRMSSNTHDRDVSAGYNNNTSTNNGPSTEQNPAAASSAPSFSTMLSIRVSEPKVLFRVLPVRLFGLSRTINTHALLDEGSSITMIDEDLANDLGLDGPQEPLHLNWFGDQSASEQSRVVQLRIGGMRRNDISHQLHNVRTVKRLKLPQQTVSVADLQTRYQNLRRLPLADLQAAEPRLLIGLDNCHLGVADKVISGDASGIVAARTKIGWVVYGHHSRSDDDKSRATVLHTHTRGSLDEIQQMVQEYFTTENFGVYRAAAPLQSDEEAHARHILAETTKRVGDRFQTGLLWKMQHPPLPPSYRMAMKRLLSVENKMKRDAEYAAKYRNQMLEYVRKGYARQLTDDEAASQSSKTWYLPHFAVVNANKPGKFRLVFDAAAEVNGVSLNTALSSGPDLHKPLIDILFGFRIGTVAVCGDIREMFCQIRMQESDQDAQRFLWRDGDSSRPVQTFVMTCMTFGATCSPCSAHYVKNKNADDFRHESEAAVRCIVDRHYVDDFVASFPTTEEAIQVTNAVTSIHRRGGFELRGLISNDRQVQSAIGGEATHNAGDIRSMEMEANATDKVLGLFWEADADVLVFRCAFHRVPADIISGNRRPTKREVLSLTMSVFDPFGMVANFMIGAKLLIQETWTVGVGWDEQLPDVLYDRWSLWQRELPQIAKCRLPRCYTPWMTTSNDIELHIFADASELAFAAVAFWRVGRGDRTWVVSFVSGKTRCAPRKLLSVPRLELQAAVLAVRLGVAIKSAHELNGVRTIYWSDSRTVVCWIRAHHRRYKSFVAHRIAEILEDSTVNEWRWIPTSENVADDATRPKWPPTFDAESRWLRGPAFLHRPFSEWPQEPASVIENELPEQMNSQFNLHTLSTETFIPYQRFSRYDRMRRMVGWIFRFIYNARAVKSSRRRGELLPDETRDSEIFLCRQIQRETFSAEIKQLSDSNSVSKSSHIYRLRPYLDNSGLLRLSGRIDAASQLSEDTRRPILLPQKHIVTDLIISHEHIRMHHQNDAAIICALRDRFWIPHARTAVRRCKSVCQKCKIAGARPVAPLMGALPEDRLLPVERPFTYTGLDYFGPVFVTVGRRREKRYVALFTCLSIRAVHLELAADLSTDACILCIRNFVNIRGLPVRIRSDNGTNFVGASRELRDCIDAFDQEALTRECSGRGIEWRFNCPSNPEAGGIWERLVRSVKRVLAVTMTETAPRVETMRSLLLEAMNIVNSRPLTHLPIDHEEDEPLTPNHFLLGTTNSTQTPGPLDPTAYCSRKQWRIAQDLKNRFWHRWMREYLPDLTRRTKWFTPAEPLKVDDLVIVCDKELPRSQWPRGRIIEVFTGGDGQVRSARIKTANGELRRPALKLAVLDVETRSNKGENPVGLVTGGAVA